MFPALLTLCLVVATDDPKPHPDAGDWLARARTTLTASDTAQWETNFEVLEAPRVEDQGRTFPFRVGTTRYTFRVKGDGWVHWAETWTGKDEVHTREAWYEGKILYLRSARDPKSPVAVTVGKGEGHCVLRSLVEGGVLGWRLAHGFDGGETGGGYVAAMKVESGGEENLGGVTAVVLKVGIGFGWGPYRPRSEMGRKEVR
jgi:hypothetical protein